VISTFYDHVAKGDNKVLDPYKQFLDIQKDVKSLTRALHKFFKDPKTVERVF